MKKLIAMGLSLAMAFSLTACGSSGSSSGGSTSGASGDTTAAAAASADSGASSGTSTDYPSKNVNGIIQWGAGGGTDSLLRPLSTIAQENLGKSIVIQNMTGATGSIATQYVYDAEPDGYNLLMGAENPTLYDVLDISTLTYSDFDCVYLIGDEVVGIIVNKDSKYNSFSELIEDALANPGQVKLSTCGSGSSPWLVGALITSVTGATFNQISYDSDASAKTAVMSGECDFTSCKVQSGIEDWKAGDLKYLCMLSTEPVEVMSEIPVVTKGYPDFEKYLPWGPFYGVFVKKGTDAAVEAKLTEAFTAAGLDASYQEVLKNFNINFKGISGDEANEYINNWRENSISALKASGAIAE